MDRLFAIVRLASLLVAGAAVVMLLRMPEPPPEESVRQTFAAYRRAVLADDGPAAAALLSAETVEWYGKMQDLTLYATKDEVERLAPLEKIQVLAFRQRVPADELRAMSPRQLVAYAVAHGWIGKPGMGRTDLGTVTASTDAAVGAVLVDGKDSGHQYNFVHEGGRWLFHQLPMLQAGNDLITTAAQQRGVSVDQYVQMLVESGSAKKITADVWQPLFPRATPAPQP